jgi:hypothetical protein
MPPTASKLVKNRIPAPLKHNNGLHQTEASTGIITTKTNASSEILFKKGARSISRKNESNPIQRVISNAL